LATSNAADRSILALQCLQSILHQSYLRSTFFNLEMCKEFLQVMTKWVSSDDITVSLALANLLQHMVAKFPSDYFDSGLGESVFHDLLYLIVFPIHKYLDEEVETKTQGELVSLLAASISTISQISRITTPQLKSVYGPIIMYSLVKSVATAHKYETIIPLLLNAMNSLTKENFPNWSNVVLASIVTILDFIETSKNSKSFNWNSEKATKKIHCLVLALAALVMSLPDELAFVDIHEKVWNTLQQLFYTSNSKLRTTALQVLRSLIQGGSQPNTAYRYLAALSGDVALTIYKMKKLYTLEDEPVASEAVKILALAFNLSPEPEKVHVMGVLLPVLIALLRPGLSDSSATDSQTTIPLLHTLALQLIMHHASTSPLLFKECVSALPAADKQVLELSVRQTVTAASAAASKSTQNRTSLSTPSTAPAKAPLKLDFSKYKT